MRTVPRVGSGFLGALGMASLPTSELFVLDDPCECRELVVEVREASWPVLSVQRSFPGRGEGVVAGRVGLTGWGSGCWSVLIDEFSAGGGAMDRCGGPDRGHESLVVGCSLAEAAVGPVRVVVR